MTDSANTSSSEVADSAAAIVRPTLAPRPWPRAGLVVMGVAGCGKSLIGARLAQALGAEALEGDTFHPARNIAKMSAGVPLADDDRAGWLDVLAGRLAEGRAQGRRIVLSCSALKRRYRDRLRQGDADLVFVCLHGERALIEARMARRTDHFMPVSLLDSQLRDLELPQDDERALLCDLAQTPDALIAAVLARLAEVGA